MTTVTLTFNPTTALPDADEDVLASVLCDDGSIEVWEAHFDGEAWRDSTGWVIERPVVSWARKPEGVDLRATQQVRLPIATPLHSEIRDLQPSRQKMALPEADDRPEQEERLTRGSGESQIVEERRF